MKRGLTVLQAHFFAFYFGCLSMIIPPVAVESMVTAKLAGARFSPTAIEATKVAIGCFIVPFLFVWCPVLLLQPDDRLRAVAGSIVSFAIVIVLQVIVCGYFLTNIGRLERGIFTVIALLIFLSLPPRNYVMLAAGVMFFILATAWQWQKRRVLASACA